MANVILDGVTYNGVDKVSLKDADNANQRVEFQTPPTLVTKNITANGTYAASSDNADGYSSVTVAVAPPSESDVNFYDYDGTLVAAYTAADFANLSDMPANPSHTGLVAEGWNWTLADAKTYVASYGKLIIGQMYHTSSGKTEYDIEVNEASGMTATLNNSAEKDWGDGTVDTNTSHTYTTAGSYTIKLSGTNLPSIQNSKKVRAVRIANGVTKIGGASTFINCVALQSVTTTSSIIGNIGNSGDVFRNCRSLKAFITPINVTKIGSGIISTPVFDGCRSLKVLSLNYGLTNIGADSFTSCSCLANITLPPTVTQINGFSQALSLTKITIPRSITEISVSCFNGTSLFEVEIPSSIVTIGAAAFANCSFLTIVTVLATTPPTVAYNSFPSNVTKIYIPNGTLATYQADTNWSTYASKLVELPA